MPKSRIRYVELLQTQRQKVPALKAAIEDLKADRLQAGWENWNAMEGVCITSHASQCRTVDQVVLLPDGADAKGWYVSLSRAREAMHVYTRDKTALRQSVMHPGERKSVWEIVQALARLNQQSRDPIMPAHWRERHAEIVREIIGPSRPLP